jgi:hypothetical protein
VVLRFELWALCFLCGHLSHASSPVCVLDTQKDMLPPEYIMNSNQHLLCSNHELGDVLYALLVIKLLNSYITKSSGLWLLSAFYR